jgi:hypothetical protein
VNAGTDSVLGWLEVVLGMMFGLMVKLVTPNAGVLTVSENVLAFRFAPLEKVGALEVAG